MRVAAYSLVLDGSIKPLGQPASVALAALSKRESRLLLLICYYITALLDYISVVVVAVTLLLSLLLHQLVVDVVRVE